MKLSTALKYACVTGIGLTLTPNVFASGLTFDLVHDAGMNSQAVAGFQAAADRWSNLFHDPITVKLNIGFSQLGPGILGSTSSTSSTKTYSAVRNAMVGDATSALDNTATAHLQAAPALQFLLNRTSDNPNGAGSATPYLDHDGDANNTTIRLNTANQKALGIFSGSPNDADGDITFSNQFSYDFDPSNGISAGKIDFVGIATHEIGHALGFISGVDILDINSGGQFSDNQFTYVNTLDLFRYSHNHLGDGKDYMDWTADNTSKFFSVDGGATMEGRFANGVVRGDGWQASHWHFQNPPKIGIMDPAVDFGQLMSITDQDVRAFDAIGYDVQSVPEPSTMALLGLGVAAFIRRRKKA